MEARYFKTNPIALIHADYKNNRYNIYCIVRKSKLADTIIDK